MGDPHNTSTTRYSAYPACGRADVNPWTEPPFIRCPDHKIKQPQQWRIFATVSTITAIASAIATRSNRQHHGLVYAIFFLYVSIDRWPMTISFLVVFFALFHLIFFYFYCFIRFRANTFHWTLWLFHDMSWTRTTTALPPTIYSCGCKQYGDAPSNGKEEKKGNK